MSGPDTPFLPGINRYPDFLNAILTRLVADRHSLSTKYVILCCGISELLYMSSQAFLGPGRDLVTSDGTFALPAYYAGLRGGEVRRIPLTAAHAVDLEALLDAVGSRTGLVYIANPDNPTGSLLRLADLEAFVEQVYRKNPETVILIDEAYMEYVSQDPPAEGIRLVFSYPVLVGRTFSKAWGMAGLRAGYVVGNEDLILVLNGFLSGFLGGDPGWRMFEGNVNRVAGAAVEASLNEAGYSHIAFVRAENASLRAWLAESLEGLGFESLPSEANFLLARANGDGENLRRWLCSRKILVQAGGSFHTRYRDWIRVSVGTRDELDAFLEAIAAYEPSGSQPACFRVFYHGI